MLRLSKEETTKKWIKVLSGLKKELDSTKRDTIRDLLKAQNVTHYWQTFLREHNVILIGEDGYWKWNEKIPVSVKLVDKFREKQHYENMRHSKSEKTIKKFNNMKQPTKPIEKTKIIIDKVDKIERIGLIRKFWRWLY
jgi:hypothetical protein